MISNLKSTAGNTYASQQAIFEVWVLSLAFFTAVHAIILIDNLKIMVIK